MDPKQVGKPLTESELDELSLNDLRLTELDAEDLLGHHVEVDELDDWRAIEY